MPKTTNQRKHPYENAAQQRVLKTMMALFGHEVDGLSPSQIAKAVDTTSSNVTRDLYNLIESGVAEKLSHNDNIRITPRLGQKAIAILNNIDSASRRLEDTRNRFTRQE
jgi:DNA-binding IclR family transcriptional regulator